MKPKELRLSQGAKAKLEEFEQEISRRMGDLGPEQAKKLEQELEAFVGRMDRLLGIKTTPIFDDQGNAVGVKAVPFSEAPVDATEK